MPLNKPPETDSYGVPIAAAPPPPLKTSQEPSPGFSARGSRLWLEVTVGLGLLGLVVVGAGLVAVYSGGAAAAALTPLVPSEFDRKLGELSTQQLALASTECTNPEAKRYVEEVARPLVAGLGATPFSFEFRVVEDAEVNAFALPGGFVTVNSGLLEQAESGEEVAGVIGHELYHALLRHGTERMLRQLGGSLLFSALLGGTGLEELGGAAKSLSNLSYDREQESEADREGAKLMLRAGFDPSGMSSLFARLAKDQVAALPVLLSNHPDSGERAKLIAELGKPDKPQKIRSPKGIACR